MSRGLWQTVALLLTLSWASAAICQDLTPRSFWPAPVGTKLFVAGYASAKGDVLMDPSVPLFGIDSEINTGFLGYMQTFGLWGRTSNLLLELPYTWGTTKGFIFESQDSKEFSGLSDAGISLFPV